MCIVSDINNKTRLYNFSNKKRILLCLHVYRPCWAVIHLLRTWWSVSLFPQALHFSKVALSPLLRLVWLLSVSSSALTMNFIKPWGRLYMILFQWWRVVLTYSQKLQELHLNRRVFTWVFHKCCTWSLMRDVVLFCLSWFQKSDLFIGLKTWPLSLTEVALFTELKQI